MMRADPGAPELLALVSEADFRSIARAIAPRAARLITSVEAFERALRGEPFSPVALDPLVLRDVQFERILDAAADRPGRMLLVTCLGIGSTERLIRAARLGFGDVWLSGHERPEALRNYFEASTVGTVKGNVLGRLAPSLRRLADPFRTGVVSLFACGATPPRLPDFCAALRMSHRAFARALTRAGISCGPNLLMNCARIGRAAERFSEGV